MAHKYHPATVTITFDSSGYVSGADYFYLHSNAGSGAMDWTNRHAGIKYVANGGTVTIKVMATTPGSWLFGVKAYDSKGNAYSTGTPDEGAIYIDLEPRVPGGMGITSYDPEAQELVLTL